MIRLSKSVVSELEAKRVSEVIIEDGYLGMGKDVNAFEQKLSDYMNRRVVCVNSGTAALHLAITAVVERGDHILVPSITYVATYQAIVAAGAIPISVDVDAATLSIDLADAEAKITDKTKAILPVLYAGNAKPMSSIELFVDRYQLRCIYDAAHAFGSMEGNNLVGSKGDIFCFSFDGIKNITCGEGGAIVSSDLDVITFCQNARLLGITNDTDKRYKGQRSWSFDVTHIGYRYHMSNLNAAIGLVQLERFESFKIKRQQLANLYHQLLSSISCISLLEIDYEQTVPHIFSLLLPVNVERELLRQFLLENGIETGVHYFPNHLLSFFSETGDCPVSESLFPRMLSLPLHPELVEEDIHFIVENVKQYINAEGEVA